MRAEAKVLHGLTSVLRTTQQQGVRAGGRTESKLVQGQDLTASLLNASTGGGRHAEGSNGQLGDRQQAVVIGHRANDDNGLVLVLLVQVGHDAGQGDRRTVDPGHEQTAQHHLVEVGIGTA